LLTSASIKEISLDEDVHDEDVPHGADDPQQEEQDAENVLNSGVNGRKLLPIFVGESQHVLRGSVHVLHA